MSSTSSPRKRSAVVVGGGLAGLVCATRMAERGFAVTVLESRGRFGGRATSWRDPALGFRLDNGPHLVAGAYEELRRHARRIGLHELTAGGEARPVVLRDVAGRRRGVLGAGRGRLSLASDLARFEALPIGSRARALRLLAAASGGVDPDRPLSAWLDACGQDAELRRWLWEPMARAICNDHPDHISAQLFAGVVERLFLRGGDSFVLSYPVPSLADSLLAPTLGYLRSRGVSCETGMRVVRVERAGEAFAVILEGGIRRVADLVCLAVPARAAAALLGGAARSVSPLLPRAAAVATTPLVSVAVWLRDGAPELRDDFFGLVDAPFAWVFDRRRLVAGAGGPEAIVLVAPGDEALARRPAAEIAELAARTLKQLGVPADGDRRHGVRVIKEMHAAPRLDPQAARERPPAETSWPGLALAGDWTATGLPATLESAAASGHRAAAALLRAADSGPWYRGRTHEPAN